MARDLTDLNREDEPRTLAVARERAVHTDRFDARAIELDDDEESQFLRTEKRVPIRRSALGKQAQIQVRKALLISAIVLVFATAALAT